MGNKTESNRLQIINRKRRSTFTRVSESSKPKSRSKFKGSNAWGWSFGQIEHRKSPVPPRKLWMFSSPKKGAFPQERIVFQPHQIFQGKNMLVFRGCRYLWKWIIFQPLMWTRGNLVRFISFFQMNPAGFLFGGAEILPTWSNTCTNKAAKSGNGGDLKNLVKW